MSGDFQTLIFAFAIGVVISGIFANVFGLVTNAQSKFYLPVTSDARRLVIVAILLFATPHIAISAAGRLLRHGEMATAHTIALYGLCALWSIGLGFLIFCLINF